MRLRTPFVAAAVAGAALAAATTAPAAGTMQLCGQLHGPHASWVLPKPHLTIAGSTWTVFVGGGATCSTGAHAAPALLAQWARNHRPGTRLRLPGWTCAVPGSSSSVACIKLGNTTVAGAFSVIETGPYSLSQIRALTGALTHR